MRLAIISNMKDCRWAGSETVWHLAAMQALRDGHCVTAFLHRDLMTARQIVEFHRAGGRVQHWQVSPVARLENIKERILPNFPSKIMRRFDAILVSLGSLPSLNYVPGLASYLSNDETPFVLFCQFNSDQLLMSPRDRATVAKVLGKSASVVFVSHRNLQEARRQFAIESPRARVILNSVSDAIEKPCPWPDASPPISFASVARLETAWKGQDLLLDVLSQPPWREREWELNFYGIGPDLDHVRRLTDFFRLSERVKFHGFIDDQASIWNNNHILLMPSRGEGTPLAALEAMMYGRPVVATDVGGLTEIIQDGITGFIAEAATLSSFSKTLERSWNSMELWKDMGLAARKSLRDRCSQNPAKALLAIWTEAATRELMPRKG